MVTCFGGDGQLVNRVHRIEVEQGANEGEHPNDEGDDERQVGAVETVMLAEEGKPALSACGVDRASSEHARQNAYDRDHRPVSKEDVSRGLTLKVHGRDELAALHRVR